MKIYTTKGEWGWYIRHAAQEEPRRKKASKERVFFKFITVLYTEN
jgi:hypothetical protein